MVKKDNQKSNINFREKKLELDSILSKLQQEDTDIDEAIELYKSGQQIIAELLDYLKHAENSITEIRSNLDKQK